MADFAGGKIQAFCGPKEHGAPDNLEEVIVNFIGGARHSLDIAVQEIDSEPIAQAILDARWRGVRVRIFLEQDYLSSEEPPEPRAKRGEPESSAVRRAQWSKGRDSKGTEINREILTAFLRNAIDVKADYNPKIFHQKFIIRDYRGRSKGSSALLTGSTNFTSTDTHRNLNHIVVFHDPKICKDYQGEFEEIRSGTFGALRERREGKPRTVNLKGVPVRVLFAPDNSPELEIIKQMLKCEKRLDFAIFTFAGSSGIDDAMVMLRKARRKVRGALDPGQGRQWWSATDWLHREGIEVFFPKKIPPFRKLHHKLMVIDSAIVIAGSMNYTAPANEYNDENIFVIGSPYPDLPKREGGPVDLEACSEIARFFRKEIDRIILRSERFRPKS